MSTATRTQLPRIIYGTAWKKQRTTELVVAAVLSGFRAIDTACQPKHYREDLVGKALLTLQRDHNIPREDLFLQTKFTSIDGQDRSKPLPYDPSQSVAHQVLTSFQTSLSNLHTSYLDSYILHSPLRTLKATIEAWHVLMSLQDEGKVRLIGVSNTYDPAILRALAEERPVQVVQNRWYEGNEWDVDVVRYCRDNGVMYQSFWTLTGSPSLLRHSSIRELAQDLGCSPAQAVYKFAQAEGIVPLSGTTNEEHMRDDVRVEDLSIPGKEGHLNDARAFVGL